MKPEDAPMKKKILALLLITIMLVALMPQTALAATTWVVGDGDTLNLTTRDLTHADNTTEHWATANDDTFVVAAGATATITGSRKWFFTCGEGVTLTVDNVNIRFDSDESYDDNICPLSFTGSGNTLILSGESTFEGGKYEPAISVTDGTELTISGSGTPPIKPWSPPVKFVQRMTMK